MTIFHAEVTKSTAKREKIPGGSGRMRIEAQSGDTAGFPFRPGENAHFFRRGRVLYALTENSPALPGAMQRRVLSARHPMDDFIHLRPAALHFGYQLKLGAAAIQIMIFPMDTEIGIAQ